MAKQPTSKDIMSATDTGTKKPFLGQHKVQYFFMLETRQMLPCKSLTSYLSGILHVCPVQLKHDMLTPECHCPRQYLRLAVGDVQVLEQYRLDVGVSI